MLQNSHVVALVVGGSNFFASTGGRYVGLGVGGGVTGGRAFLATAGVGLVEIRFNNLAQISQCRLEAYFGRSNFISGFG